LWMWYAVMLGLLGSKIHTSVFCRSHIAIAVLGPAL
jgi:hypothetical protein